MHWSSGSTQVSQEGTDARVRVAAGTDAATLAVKLFFFFFPKVRIFSSLALEGRTHQLQTCTHWYSDAAEWRFQLDFCLKEMTKITHPLGIYVITKNIHLSIQWDRWMYSFVFFTERMMCTDVHPCFILPTRICCHFSDEEKRSRRAWLALFPPSIWCFFVGSSKMYFSVWEVMLQCWWLERLS